LQRNGSRKENAEADSLGIFRSAWVHAGSSSPTHARLRVPGMDLTAQDRAHKIS